MRLTKTVALILITVGLIYAEFDPSRFNFGTDWDYLNTRRDGSVADAVDYVSVWLVTTSLNDHCRNMLTFCKNKNKTPVFYGYVIAKASGLGDQNTGGSLDINGGSWIRSNINTVKNSYAGIAQQIANSYGTSDPVIFLMEPDYYQYCNGNSGQDISVSEAAGFMKEIINSISGNLPNAVFSMDISPWCGNFSGYVGAFDMSQFSLMSTSGGETQGHSSQIRGANSMTWGQVYGTTDKCIIADVGYGAGGASTGHDAAWDDLSNIKNRINDGVVAITQKNPNDNWGSTINSLKSSLSSVPTKWSGSGFKKGYSLSVTPTSGGTVNISPEATTYDSGSTVTLTAVPGSGYKFRSWGGDTVASGSTLTLKMVKDWTVTASFVDIDAKATFILTVNTTGAGVVEVDPKKAEYDSGTIVLLTPYVVDDEEFLRWEGALSGSATPAAIVMDANKTVKASFSGSTITRENLVRNGSFDEGGEEWSFGSYEGASAEGSVESGSYNVAVATPGDESWKIQLTQGGISLVEDEDYVLTFSASAQSATQIIVNVGMAAEPYESYSREKTIDLSDVMEVHEIKFTMNKASTSEARLEFNCGKASSHLVIDNVSLMKDLELTSPVLTPDIRRSVQPVLPDVKDAVTVSLYDYAGRLLQQTSGDYRSLMNHKQMQRPGCYIAVVRFAGRRIAKKMVVVR